MAIDFIDSSTLDDLMSHRAGVCVSIYLPMARKGPEIRGNAVQLKNQLNEVAARLESTGWRPNEIDAFLEGPRTLLNDTDYWQNQHDGLALFLAPDLYELFRVPLQFEPLTIVSDRFHIKPLLPLFNEDGAYYILSLSQKNVRLFKATRHSIEEVDEALLEAAEIPRSVDEALAFDDPEEQLQHHTTTSGAASAGGPEVVHHGHSPEDEKNQRVRRFLQQVATGMSKLLRGDKAPVVVAAVGYMQPIFEDVSRLPNLADEIIEGNPDHTQPETLREQAWEIVAGDFMKAKEQATARYKELAHGGKATDSLEEIVPAAIQGRIESLFVALDDHTWGTYSLETNAITVEDPDTQNSEDLLDFAAVHTLSNGGDVYAVESGELPGETSIAAVLRY